MKKSPLFLKDDRIFANIPKDASISYADLVTVAKELTGKGLYIDWTALREAFIHARDYDFPIGSADPADLLNEKLKIRFSEDRITAYLTLYAPKPKGRKLGEHEVRELIAAYGVDQDLLELHEMRTALMRRDYGDAFKVAVGARPLEAEPYSIVWDAPPTDSEGFLHAYGAQADIPTNVLRVVRPSQVAGKRIKPLPGKPGYTVQGDVLEPKPSEDPFVLGKGLSLSANGAMVMSDTRGHLKISGDHGVFAEVVPVMEFDGLPGIMEITKPAFYPGSVIFNGDLELNAVLRVLGDVEIRGALIGAGVETCGSLIVRDGIINNEKNGIHAKGAVSAGFLERARVWADSIHIRRYSLHSKLLAINGIVGPSSSSLNGGEAEAGGFIHLSILGSANATPTRVSISGRAAMIMRDVFKDWLTLVDNQAYREENPIDLVNEEIDKLKRMITKLGHKVRLEDTFIKAETVYPGVRVVIGSGMREPGEKMGPVTFTPERIGDKERVAMTRL